MEHTAKSPGERRPDCAALDSVNNTAKTTQPSPHDEHYNHNTVTAQSPGYSVRSIQRQQPLIHHAHPPLSFRPRTMAHLGVTTTHSGLDRIYCFPAAGQAQSVTSSRSGLPLPHDDSAPKPLSSSNAVSTSQQQAQKSSCMRSRGCDLNDDHATQAGPASSRRRSRSPTLTARPVSYRDRSPARHQGSSALDPSVDNQPAGALDGVGDLNMGDADIVDKQLRMAELQKEKNKHAVCVHCWLQELPCDHQWPCKECKVRGKSCAYIACPMENCALAVKCPAYHTFKKLPKENRKIGCPMHMIALLNLNRPFVSSYDVQKIQKKIETPTSAQQIYLMLQQEIKDIVQQKNTLDDTMARKLLQESENVPRLGHKSLKKKARFIVKLVKEMKSQPFLELWEHDRRQRKSASQAKEPMEAEDTPMLDSEG
ncbi:hypothetical protein KCU93_g1929, partial [Aureobasidium melanogenum]